jgi:hypothetical protein
VQGGNGCLGGRRTGHGDEGKPSRPAGIPVGDDADTEDITMGSEQLGQLHIRGAPRQITDVDLGGHVVKRASRKGTKHGVRLSDTEGIDRPTA